MDEQTTVPEKEVSVETLKEQGNQAVKENKYLEALLHYTHAIKLDPQNYALYSNRSFAHLMLQHHYLALADANETVALNPSWPKGYFRKGEVEFAAEQYSNAYESYQMALALKPDDTIITQALNNTAKKLVREKKMDKEVPWVGAGLGIIIGVFLLVTEYVTSQSLTHPLIMSFITMGMSVFGYGIARFFRTHLKSQKKALLEPPPDLFDSSSSTQDEEENEGKKRTPRYTKSQARMRYKKGKL